MKLKKVFSVVAALALVFCVGVGASQAAMWVGPEIGANFNAPIDVKVNGPFANRTLYGVKARSGFTGGIMMGYDFVNYGTGAYAYPDWMKYFGVAMGVSYNQLYIDGPPVVATAFVTPGVQKFTYRNANMDGSNLALTFLAIGKFPMMVDANYPMGRLAPYVGVGPAVVFTTMDFAGGSQTSTNVGLVTEAGLRYMITPEFSASLAYRYRYHVPSFDVGRFSNVTVTGSQNTSQVLLRLAYHF